MAKMLNEQAVQQYRDEGFYSPVPVLKAHKVAHYRAKLEAHEATTGGRLDAAHRSKSYLLFQWVDDHFEHTPRPSSNFDPEAVAFHSKANVTLREIVYAGAKKVDPKL